MVRGRVLTTSLELLETTMPEVLPLDFALFAEAGLLWVFHHFQPSADRAWKDTPEYKDQLVTSDLERAFSTVECRILILPNFLKPQITQAAKQLNIRKHQLQVPQIQLSSQEQEIQEGYVVIVKRPLCQGERSNYKYNEAPTSSTSSHHPRKITLNVRVVVTSFLKLSR